MTCKNLNFHKVDCQKYLCIIRSHEVTKIASWNADINVLSHGNNSTLDHIKISTDMEHNLTQKTTPVNGISHSVTIIHTIFKPVRNVLS